MTSRSTLPFFVVSSCRRGSPLPSRRHAFSGSAVHRLVDLGRWRLRC